MENFFGKGADVAIEHVYVVGVKRSSSNVPIVLVLANEVAGEMVKEHVAIVGPVEGVGCVEKGGNEVHEYMTASSFW